jgi:hypothetical protein
VRRRARGAGRFLVSVQEGAQSPGFDESGLPDRQVDQQQVEQQRGLALLQVYAQSPDWVKRRVDQLQFIDTRAIRWRRSIDFAVPNDAPQMTSGGKEYRLVPVTSLPKANLVGFDLRDESDSVVWLPTSTESHRWVAQGIVAFAKSVLGRPLPVDLETALLKIMELDAEQHRDFIAPFTAASDVIDARKKLHQAKAELERVATACAALRLRHPWRLFKTGVRLAAATRRLVAGYARRSKAEAAWATVRTGHRKVIMELMNDTEFCSQFHKFATDFLALVPVAQEPGTRRVVKLAHEAEISFKRARGPLRRLLQGLGWRCWPLQVNIGAEGGSHHLEAIAPSGVDVVGITAGLPSHDIDLQSALKTRGGSPRVHLAVPANHRYLATIHLRVSRPGWLTASWVASLVIAMVFVFGWFNLAVFFGQPSTGVNDVRSTAAQLSLAVLAVIATVLIRPGEHPLAARLLRFARALIAVDVLAILLGTGDLIAHNGSQEPRTLWMMLAMTTGAVTILLTLTRLLPRERDVPVPVYPANKDVR